jgi:hypothetical protein
LSGKGNQQSTRRETEISQFTRREVLTCLKSLEYDPKPVELTVGKVKQLSKVVEA